jgi:hypothetical protein
LLEQKIIIRSEYRAELNRLQRHAGAKEQCRGVRASQVLTLVMPGAQADRIAVPAAHLAGVLVEIQVMDLARSVPAHEGAAGDAAYLIDPAAAPLVRQALDAHRQSSRVSQYRSATAGRMRFSMMDQQPTATIMPRSVHSITTTE